MAPPGSYNYWSILPKLYLRTALFSNLHQKGFTGSEQEEKYSTSESFADTGQQALLPPYTFPYYISHHPHWKRPAWRAFTSPIVCLLPAVRIRTCSALPLLTVVREALTKTLKLPGHVPRDPCACFRSTKQGVDFMDAQITPSCAHAGSVETSLKFEHALDFDLWSWEPGCNFQV